MENKKVCDNCGLLISKSKLHKHLSRDRCKRIKEVRFLRTKRGK